MSLGALCLFVLEGFLSNHFSVYLCVHRGSAVKFFVSYIFAGFYFLTPHLSNDIVAPNMSTACSRSRMTTTTTTNNRMCDSAERLLSDKPG
jgi:hypothetical protein